MQRNFPVLITIALILSIILNIFFLYNKYGYRWKQPKVSKIKEIKVNQYYLRRNELYKQFNIPDSAIIFIGDSHVTEFPLDEFFPKFNIINRGINGDYTKGVLERLEDYDLKKAKSIFLQVGINDIAIKRTTDTIIATYKEIIKKIIQNSDANLFVNSILPIDSTLHSFYNIVPEINQEIEEICAEYEVTYINCYDAFLKGNHLNEEYANYDGYHLSASGYKLWAKILMNYFYEEQ